MDCLADYHEPDRLDRLRDSHKAGVYLDKYRRPCPAVTLSIGNIVGNRIWPMVKFDKDFYHLQLLLDGKWKENENGL